MISFNDTIYMFGFTIITALAAIFRTIYPELIEFKADEAQNLFLAARPIFGHPFPPGATVSSIGILNPPLINYLLFPFTLISLNPKAISLMIGLLNSLFIGIFFLIVKKYYGMITAIFSSLLMAFSPWMILFSRKIWAQDLLVPFVVILFLSIHKLLVDKKTKYWLVYTLISLLLIQLHQSSLIFIIILTTFLIKKVKINFFSCFLGVVLGFLPLIPYFLYVLNNLWIDPSTIIVSGGKFSATFFPVIFIRPLQILSQGNFRFILGDDNLTFAHFFPFVYQFKQISYLEYLLVPLGMVLFWKDFKNLRFLIYSTIILLIVYFFLHFSPFMHYILILTPFLFLFLGYALFFLYQQKDKLIKISSLILFTTFITVSILFNAAFLRLLDIKKEIKGDYGVSFVVLESQTKEKFKKYQGHSDYQEIILTSYLPGQFLYGYLPVAKMLFPYNKTLNDLPSLEKRLLNNHDDPRIRLQLTAFYTTYPVTKSTLGLLKTKSQQNSGYLSVYETAKGLLKL